MIITVDTSENKSLQYIDTWNALRPQKSKEITWSYQSLDYGDIRGERGQIFEIKIDEDLGSSLKSGHLEEQLRYMYACAEHSPR
jgi:ERCC4-type nuclease